jgi:beta-lactamase superfamily II metal-dependent hydrolase
VVSTHPQKDHYGGLVDVFQRYKVDYFLANALDSSSIDYQVLENAVGGSGAKVVNPTNGMVIRLGMMQLDIVWPTEEFIGSQIEDKNIDLQAGVLGAYTSEKDPNEFSIVTILRLGDFNALLTGDIQPPVVDDVIDRMKLMGVDNVDYIKIPHHGSKNGLTEDLLRFTRPEIAVISVGKRNSYGHPNQQTLDLLQNYKVKVLRTDEVGNVEVITDGEKLFFQKL